MYYSACMNILFSVLPAIFAAASATAAPKGGPSRPPVKGCAWEKLSDRNVGLEAWVQKCDFGFRKIELKFQNNSLALHYSDGGSQWDPLVDVFDLLAGETAEAAAKRLFSARTDRALAARCVLAPYKDGRPRTGVKRYTFVPDKKYDRKLAARGAPDSVPDPACGDWGDAPDGIQYWEAQPASNARKILFVRVGQDEPLFDEQTLKLVAAR